MRMFFYAAALCYCATSNASSLCQEGETTIFDCTLKKTSLSFCMAPDNSFIYRAGSQSKIDLYLKQDGGNKKNKFFFSSTMYPGGGESHIRFSNGTYNYFLFDRTIKEDDGPASSSGVVIFNKQKRIAASECQNDASIHAEAYSNLTKEEYKNIFTSN